MPIRADSNNSFLQRFLLIAIVCYGFALWSLYDGLVGYPAELDRVRYFEELADRIPDKLERRADWEAKAKEMGWSLADPKKTSKEIESDIQWQYGMALVAFIVGTAVLINYLRTRSSWVELDGKQLKASWGQVVPLDAIIEIDKKRWANKGIARIRYQDGDSVRQFVLDDFKYDRDAMDKIMRAIEEAVERNKITGGPTQTEMDRIVAEQKAEKQLEIAESTQSGDDPAIENS